MRYLRIFFTFLGYCSFIFMVCAATFIYIGKLKKEKAATAMPAATLQVLSMNTDTVAAERPNIIREFKPISRSLPAQKHKPAVAARKKRPIASTMPRAAPKPKPMPPKRAEPKPVLYTATVKEPWRPAKKTTVSKRRWKKPAAAQPLQTELPPCTLSFRATDNSANQRTGRGTESTKQIRFPDGAQALSDRNK